jgi:hypothetical protein
MHSRSKLFTLSCSVAILAALLVPAAVLGDPPTPDYTAATSIETPTGTGSFTVSIDDNDDFYFSYQDIDTTNSYLKMIAGSSIANLASDTPEILQGVVNYSPYNIEGSAMCQYQGKIFACDSTWYLTGLFDNLTTSIDMGRVQISSSGIVDPYFKNDHRDNGVFTYILGDGGTNYNLKATEASAVVSRQVIGNQLLYIDSDETIYNFTASQVPSTPKIIHNDNGGTDPAYCLFATRLWNETDSKYLVYSTKADWDSGSWGTPTWFQSVDDLYYGSEGDNFDVASLNTSGTDHFGTAYITNDASSEKHLYYAASITGTPLEIASDSNRIDDVSLILMESSSSTVEPVISYTKDVEDINGEYNIHVYSRHMTYSPMEWYVCRGANPELVYDDVNSKVYLFYIHDGSYYARLVFDGTYEYQ